MEYFFLAVVGYGLYRYLKRIFFSQEESEDAYQQALPSRPVQSSGSTPGLVQPLKPPSTPVPPSSLSSEPAQSAKPSTRSIQPPKSRVEHHFSFSLEVSSPATSSPSLPRKNKGVDDIWVPVGEPVQVRGFKIPGGLLYVGQGLGSVSSPDYSIEPALIDPSLKASNHNLDRKGETFSYWPSYSDLQPCARGAYLEWLANGRNNPDIGIGYVFLFFIRSGKKVAVGYMAIPEGLGGASRPPV